MIPDYKIALHDEFCLLGSRDIGDSFFLEQDECGISLDEREVSE
jgi:hypothetical protein